MNAKAKDTGDAKVAKGDAIQVLDWSRDPQNPVVVDATVTAVRADGTVNAHVTPEHCDAYHQEGLTRWTTGKFVPGQYRVRPVEEAAPAAETAK